MSYWLDFHHGTVATWWLNAITAAWGGEGTAAVTTCGQQGAEESETVIPDTIEVVI